MQSLKRLILLILLTGDGSKILSLHDVYILNNKKLLYKEKEERYFSCYILEGWVFKEIYQSTRVPLPVNFRPCLETAHLISFRQANYYFNLRVRPCLPISSACLFFNSISSTPLWNPIFLNNNFSSRILLPSQLSSYSSSASKFSFCSFLYRFSLYAQTSPPHHRALTSQREILQKQWWETEIWRTEEEQQRVEEAITIGMEIIKHLTMWRILRVNGLLGLFQW